MTLLTIIQDASAEVGVSSPANVISNPDSNTARMLALSNRGGKALAQRFNWQELTREFTFSTIAQEDQGAISTLMPGFNFDVYRTIWNRTSRMRATCPLFPDEWQHLKALNFTGTFPQFRVRGDRLLAIPIPSAGQVIAGEYVSKFWCQGLTGQDRWAADSDTGTLSEDLLTLDLVWRWKQALGLTYAEEKQELEIQVNNAMSRNGNNRVLSLEGCDRPFSTRGFVVIGVPPDSTPDPVPDTAPDSIPDPIPDSTPSYITAQDGSIITTEDGNAIIQEH